MDNSQRSNSSPLIPDDEVALGYNETSYQLYCMQELNKSTDLVHFKYISQRLVRGLGLTDFSFGRMKNPNPEAAMIMYTYHVATADPYKDKTVWQNDFMLQYAASNDAPILQSTIDRYVDSAGFLTEGIRSNRYTRELVKSYGYLDFYNFPLEAANSNGNVLVAFTAKRAEPAQFREIISSKQRALRILAKSIDYIGTRRFPSTFLGQGEPTEIAINRRPLQLLSLLAKYDLSLNEAALEMNISISTANQQIKAAKDAFGANTTSGAIYKALKSGLID